MMHPEQKPYKTARDTQKIYGIAGNITLKLHGMHLKPDTGKNYSIIRLCSSPSVTSMTSPENSSFAVKEKLPLTRYSSAPSAS